MTKNVLVAELYRRAHYEYYVMPNGPAPTAQCRRREIAVTGAAVRKRTSRLRSGTTLTRRARLRSRPSSGSMLAWRSRLAHPRRALSEQVLLTSRNPDRNESLPGQSPTVQQASPVTSNLSASEPVSDLKGTVPVTDQCPDPSPCMRLTRQPSHMTVFPESSIDASTEVDLDARAWATHRTGRAAHILMVDDDEATLRLCQHVLERAGCRVSTLNCAQHIVDAAVCKRPDLILVDLEMPGISGIEATRLLKSHSATSSIPVLMLSGCTDQKSVLAGYRVGIDEYITKPITPQELVCRVRSSIRIQFQRHDLYESNCIRADQARMLSELLDLSGRLTGLTCLEPILQHVLRSATEITACARVAIALPNDEDQCSLFIAASTEDGEHTQAAPTVWNVADRVFMDRKPLLINSEADWASLSRLDAEIETSVKSVPFIVAPMTAALRAVGVLIATDRINRQPFEPHVLEVLHLLTNIAASAIDDQMMRQARDEAYDSIVRALATLAEYRDDDTGHHLDRVTRYSVLLATALQQKEPYSRIIDDRFIHDLQRAMPLHDIGKVTVPDAILLKPGRLDDDEMAIMRQHTTSGYNALKTMHHSARSVTFLSMARDIALNHHERVDGKGYPNRRGGDEIPLSARIAAIADVYDALRSERVYKKAMSHEQARRIILDGAGTQFDPDLIEVFKEVERDFARLAEDLRDPDRREPVPHRPVDATRAA